jgi:undecaprenyl-diphosphatase
LSPVHALVLGVVQGLTEFLPISSSAHLVLVPWLLGWPEHSLTYDVALHMGTLAALLAYFWRDWWGLLAAWLPGAGAADRRQPGAVAGPRRGEAGRQRGSGESAGAPGEERAARRRLGLGLVLGSVPAAVVGALFADQIEGSLRAPAAIGMAMIAAAVVLALADRRGGRTARLETVTIGQALAVGVVQTLALAPGVSRSGITLAAALMLGLQREAAARYVFLLGVPITAGAGLFELRHLVRDGIPADERAAFALGIATSLVVGLLAIGGLLRYLRRRSLSVFVAYRVIVGVLVLAVAALRAS